MKRKMYETIERYMLDSMKDSAHDPQHLYRVLNTALDIARFHDCDTDVVIAAALLHDCGREEQYADPNLDHAEVGAEKAYAFLQTLGWPEAKAAHVRDCVYTHRFRKAAPPQSIEAKIIFDSDKVDVTGAIGIARTFLFGALINEPIYRFENGELVVEADHNESGSFLEEYDWKLRKIYDGFHTERGREIALGHQAAAVAYYEAILGEIRMNYQGGKAYLAEKIED